MAEKKKKKIVAAGSGQEIEAPQKKTVQKKEAAPVGNAGGLRIGAVVLWVLAVVMEALALFVLLGKINLKFMPTMWQLIAFLVLDLVFLIIGSQLWKKSNRIDPASEKNKLKFWLWNNMGLIVAVVAFLPIIALLLSNKNLDKKTKVIATVVAVIALLIGGVASYDFDPASEEMQEAAVEALGDENVFWSPFGKVYHTHDDCQSLNQSDTLTYGTVEQAMAANRTRLCSFCAKRDDITGVVTDDVQVDEVVTEDETAEDATE